MAKQKFILPWEPASPHVPPSERNKTPLIYYGGKSRDARRIIGTFPPHSCFVDSFGGGGSIILSKYPSANDVYNDIGNVSHFFEVLRASAAELYSSLYCSPFSREEFEACSDCRGAECGTCWRCEQTRNGYTVEWARRWFIVINQGYTHEESSNSFHVSTQVSVSRAFANHVDRLPYISERFRRVTIEHLSFERLIPMYDKVGPDGKGTTLFYCDPPYLPETRVDTANYENEMTIEQHEEMLKLLVGIRGQAVVSGYNSDLYNDYLKGWRVVEWTHKSAIQNSSSLNNRGSRTEVLWIKEHHYGLWSR